jgi:SAM-dependent methyltransferase
MKEINYSAQLLEREYEGREPIRTALRLLKETFGIDGQTVAEFGSGLGYNLDIFSPQNKVIGIEGLCVAAEAATARGIATITADLSAAVPLESGTCDVVLCLDVLEHLMDPGLCLREAYRILRPTGIVAINVPNHFSLSGRINIALGSGADSVKFFPDHADWENPHVRFFRHSSIVKLLANSGFRMEADWTSRFPSIPIVHGWPFVRRSKVARALARHAPELFAGGFFIIGRKPVVGGCT